MKGNDIIKKSVAYLLIAAALLLCACVDTPQPTEPTQPSQSIQPTQSSTLPTNSVPVTTSPTTAPTEITVPTEPVVTEPAEVFVHPLNGQILSEPFQDRVVAVMLNNIVSAMPQFGNGRADVLYEMLAEGGITRCMGIYGNIADVPKVGSIRSARKYYVDLALGYHAFYVHFGGSAEADSFIKQTRIPDLNGLVSDQYFFRDYDRLNSGYASEHTWFIDGKKIMQYAAERGINMVEEVPREYGFTFDDSTIIGIPANVVTAYFNMDGKPSSYTKYTKFTYNPEERVYYAEQYNNPYIDAGTGATLSFSNVVVLSATNYLQEDRYHMTIETVGGGSGYYVALGQLVPIRWSRADMTDSFVFTLEDGSPLTFQRGKTYIGIVPKNATVEYSE